MAVLTDVATIPLLYAASFLLGCAETVYDNAGRAMLPAVVHRAQRERGNSLLSTGENVGNIFLGAPIGAWLFAVAAVLPLWGNAVTYLIAAALIVTVSGQFRTERTEPTSIGRSAAMGLSEMLSATALLLMGLVQTPVAGMVGYALSAAAVSAFNVQVMSVRQALIPAAMFGRVQGAYRTLLWGGIPLGMRGCSAAGWGCPRCS